MQSGGVAGKLANGWQLSGIVIAQSGFPFSVASGRDNSFSGIGSDFTDFLGGTATLPGNRSRGEQILQWFDTSRFTANAIGTYGNSGRNIIRGPGFLQADASILKNTPITERVQLQFRGEVFNVLNRPNFRLPNSTATSAQVGRITAVVDDNQRIIQLGLKLLF
ncbi:MAG: hypothetical protein ACK6DY_06225 [Acidobacteriota bacterium]